MIYDILKQSHNVLLKTARKEFNEPGLKLTGPLIKSLFGGNLNKEYIGSDESDFIKYIKESKNWKKDDVASILTKRFPTLVQEYSK